MGKERKIRVLIAKPGLNGHDRGAKVVARGLAEAGMEVIYGGLWNTPEEIAEMAIQEDVDVVGLSILSGAHDALVPAVRKLLDEKGGKDIILLVGGTIPLEDIEFLKKECGVTEVFVPGTTIQSIVDCILKNVKRKMEG
ncbi:cobalamin B12-binding domain-containing protein [Candidatus Bathyarchaeota archaeon]|nr:MAG: cobalamin B12-binding domain-containing protein [Candidatus Bathyarchaeota archaeon]